MKVLAYVVVALAAVQMVFCSRAFPVESENMVVNLFQGVNPRIEWDPTNFLVDYSGQFTRCSIADTRQQGELIPAPTRTTPEGERISGLVDYERGTGTDADSVNMYIANAMNDWTTDSRYRSKISSSTKFGCSVQPGCDRGYIAISCLFNSDGFLPNPPPPPENIIRPTPAPPEVQPDAQSFTDEQYDLTAAFLQVTWDRSHYLENLSGTETSCEMLGAATWDFDDVIEVAAYRGLLIEADYGYAPNLGDTEEGMVEVLANWKLTDGGSNIGCSIVPDCVDTNGAMWVIISCLHQLN